MMWWWILAAHAATFTVDDGGDQPDDIPGDGVCGTMDGTCTFVAAMQEAEATANSDRIDLPSGELVLPTGVGFVITAPLEIVGAGRESTRLHAASSDALFHIDATDFSLRALSIETAAPQRTPTAVRFIDGAQLSLHDVRLAGTSAQPVFVIRLANATAPQTAISLERFIAEDCGGTVYVNANHDVDTEETTFDAHDVVMERSGGFYFGGGVLTSVTDASFLGDASGRTDGGISIAGASATLERLFFDQVPGALIAYDGQLIARDLHIEGARQPLADSAQHEDVIQMLGADGTFERVYLYDNEAKGGFHSGSGTHTIDQLIVSGNHLSGPALELSEGSIARNMLVTHNVTTASATVRAYTAGYLEHATIAYNRSDHSADSATGGMYTSAGPPGTQASVAWSVFAHNVDHEGMPADCWGTFTSHGPNLVSAAPAACAFHGEPTQSGSPTTPLDPVWQSARVAPGMFAPLPLPGSPLLDAAAGSTLSLDAAGRGRPQDGDQDGTPIADLGAVER